MHWIAWDKLTEANERGGLGFKDLKAFNMELLCNQVWRLIFRPNSLLSKVIKHKYFPKSDIFDVPNKAGDSWL